MEECGWKFVDGLVEISLNFENFQKRRKVVYRLVEFPSDFEDTKGGREVVDGMVEAIEQVKCRKGVW